MGEKTYGPVYASLPPSQATDPDDLKALRAGLFWLLGDSGDPAVVREANGIADRYLRGERTSDPQQENVSLKIALEESGTAGLFDRVQQLYLTANDPHVKSDALSSLAFVTDPALVRRALDFFVSDKVSKQDSASEISTFLYRKKTRDQAWAYIKTNWPAVSDRSTTFSGASRVYSTGSFCSREAQTDVAEFFKMHPVPASERALKGSQERIAGCARLHGLQHAALADWLKTR